jgi:tetratricopeptide (TPR) repeat protein
MKCKLYKFLIVIVSLLSLFSVSSADNAQIDKIKSNLLSAPDTHKYSHYNELIMAFIANGDYNNAMQSVQQSLKLNYKLNHLIGIAESYNSLGVIYFYKGNYPEALKNYFIGLRYFEKTNIQRGLAQSYLNIGIVYGAQKDYKNSIKNFNKSLKIHSAMKDLSGEGYLLLNLGDLHTATKQYSNAIEYFKKAIRILEAKKMFLPLTDAYGSMAQCLIKVNQLNEANVCIDSTLSLSKRYNNKHGYFLAHYDYGDYFKAQGNTKEAIKYWEIALNYASNAGTLEYQSDLYKSLSEVYYSTKNYEKSIKYFKEHIVLKDSIFNDDNSKKLLASQIQYDFDKKAAAIKSQQAIKDAVAKEKIQQQKIIIVSVILGSGLLLFGLLFFIYRRKSKHALEVNKLENKTLRSQLNPHFIFNALASIQKYMNEYPDKAENYLAKFAKLMRAVLENSEKEYISLEDEFEMLKNYMDLEKLRVKNGFTYQFNIHENIDLEEIQTPPLLLQPIIENAIWHGVAKDEGHGEIIINVDKANEFLRFEIENKSDIKLEEQVANNTALEGKRKSFGQQIVRERLNLLSKEKGKKCQMEMASTAHGMKVIVLIPNLN